MKNALKYWFIIAGLCLMASCEDDGEDVSYSLPETYNFENVNYSGQTTRLDMMAEMTTYMKTGNEGAVLDAQKLKNMYANLNNPFENSGLNTASKDLKSKTFELDRSMFEGFMEALAEASTATQEGSNGVAGVVSSNDGSKKYLMDENGVEYTQVIEKGLMGAVFYYQATAVYFSEEKIGPAVDNTEITEGEGTAMQHHWDEAFGYLGVPQDFPSNTEDARFWGKYGNDRNDLLETNTIMNDFIKGRAAIVNGDMDTKYEMVNSIRNKWEMISAGTAIHYINSALNNFADDALRNHALSEAWAFVQSLKYNPDRRISLDQIEEIQQLLGNNFYEVSTADLNGAKDLLAELYEMESIQNDL
ncbi:hypothetical protein OKW21_003053 [Catalinimonas alkaloidigena]|uniref:DUF4856 domain-containing protein n=1 Tax=Catalinimonas alkaloidigena TaxID=1075417 RepID=UPI002404BED4|nr:DUF4856 domain-containing protein [Catalinimonas alkaloidigena]MDF9797790.1 hypothetical protein [Catalinimonas alkaloidigena]